MQFTKTFSVAPMMELTDRHCRTLMRILTKKAILYTEMVVWGSIVYGDKARFLDYHECEHPIILQLGGNNPMHLATCAKLAQQWHYDGVNLNVGCPSDRVKNGAFGASLMAQPTLVSDCVAAMLDAVDIPVTVKTRIGIDDRDSYQELVDFIATVSEKGCNHFIVHARKAWLKGLSPKENRSIPPLKYDVVYQLKRDFPHLAISINGGITDMQQTVEHLEHVDGVMMGREAYYNPWVLTEVDELVNSLQSKNKIDNDITPNKLTRVDAVHQYLNYMESQLIQGVYLRRMTIHMLSLFHGQPGAKAWRRYLSENSSNKMAGLEVVEQALKFVDTDAPSSSEFNRTRLAQTI